MKQKRALGFVLVCLIILVQMPFTAFAADTEAIIEVNADHLSPDTLKVGKVDRNYKQNLSFDWESAGTKFQSYSWNIIDGALPPGLTLYPKGVTAQPWIEGTPTKAGTYSFTIRGFYTRNELIVDAVKTYTLSILPNPLEINNTNLLNGNEESSYWSKVYEGDGRTVTWSMTLEDGSELPDGLSIDATSGEINWESPVQGKYNLKITATRGEESTSKVLKLIIEPEDGCTHEGAKKTERKAATCRENGMADYWYCDTCEQYFLDAEWKRSTSSDSLDKLYTVGFHSDKIGKNSGDGSDGFCDTCGKAMPVFKKVTNENEITSGGMYLVVSKIGDKYYTFKDLNNLGSIDAVEITKNFDDTFSYPESDSDVMILKTEFAAECGELDAGQPRYSFGTTINGIPYSLSSEDYSGSVYMSSYGNSKYGYRMKLTDDAYVQLASVYAEYWGSGDTEKEGNSSILAAFEGKKDSEPKLFFSFTTKDAYESKGVYTSYGDNYFYDADSLSTYPIELYKLIYTGSVNEHNYTLSDTQSIVTIDDSEFPVIYGVEGKGCSTVSGIGEAVKTDYVKKAISEQTGITGDVSVTAYADINVKSEDVTVGDYGYTNINSIVYTITPKIAIKDSSSEELTVLKIDDENFDGSEMTVSLCVGNMEPQQIIHHKTDGTKEYFYSENSEQAKNGAKSFSKDLNYTQKGDFVTFTVDSFSEIEILATAKEEPITTGNATVTVPVGGETPSFTAVSDDPSRYSVELLKWVDVENNMDFNEADLTNINSSYYNYKFEAGKKYEVQVRFTAADGYELSYSNNFTINGEKTWWRSNGLIRTYVFVPNTDTVADKNENKFTVTGYNIDGCTVILALYKEDSDGNSQLVECQTAEYSGSEKTFTTTATDYTSAKVTVWKNLTTIKPVTEVEIVDLNNKKQ